MIHVVTRKKKQYFYSLTLDKATTDTLPKKSDYIKEVKKLMKKIKAYNISPYPVQCFEEKHKSIRFPNWLHYHTLLVSHASFIPYFFTKIPNYSVKLEKLYTPYLVAVWCGYIMKNKIDICNVVRHNTIQQKSVISAGRTAREACRKARDDTIKEEIDSYCGYKKLLHLDNVDKLLDIVCNPKNEIIWKI